MTINKQALRERYSPQPLPKCHICDTEMTVQRMSATRITYGCTGATYDDKGCHYAAERSIADDHYEQSIVTVVDVSDPDVLALLDQLEVATDACNGWQRKYAEADERLRAAESGFAPLTVERLIREKEELEKRIAELEARTLPPLNDDLVAILGRPNFTCVHLAELLRKSGEDIRRKSEFEQAAVIHWFLRLYLEHGDKWEGVAKADIQSRVVAAGIGKGE